MNDKLLEASSQSSEDQPQLKIEVVSEGIDIDYRERWVEAQSQKNRLEQQVYELQEQLRLQSLAIRLKEVRLEHLEQCCRTQKSENFKWRRTTLTLEEKLKKSRRKVTKLRAKHLRLKTKDLKHKNATYLQAANDYKLAAEKVIRGTAAFNSLNSSDISSFIPGDMS